MRQSVEERLGAIRDAHTASPRRLGSLNPFENAKRCAQFKRKEALRENNPSTVVDLIKNPINHDN